MAIVTATQTSPTIIPVRASVIRVETDGTFTAITVTSDKWIDCQTETNWKTEAAAREWLAA